MQENFFPSFVEETFPYLLSMGFYSILSYCLHYLLTQKSDYNTSINHIIIYFLGCSLTLSATSTITTPLYPMNYPNKIICNYTFIGIPSYRERLSVRFSHVAIEDSESCTADSLSIYDGNNSNSSLLDNLCGTKEMVRYMTSGKALFIQFKSNSIVAKQGFRASLDKIFVGMPMASSINLGLSKNRT